MWAANKNLFGTARMLLEAGANMDLVDSKGCSAFMISCQYGALAVFLLLLNRNPKCLEERDPRGSSGLHWAAYKGHEDVVHLLLEYGMTADVKCGGGYTPLHRAMSNSRLGLAGILIENGPKGFYFLVSYLLLTYST